MNNAILPALCTAAIAATSATPAPSQATAPTAVSAEKLLAGAVGKWDLDFEIFMPGMSIKGRGHAVGKSILKGRFVRVTIDMKLRGRQMLHEVTLGHDAFLKHFDFTLQVV